MNWDDIPAAITAAGHSPWLAAFAIVLATFIHEDLTTIGVGIAVAEGIINSYVGLAALVFGIVTGDWGLYGLGRLAALNRSLATVLDRKKIEAAKHWVDRRLILGVFMVRFLPGLRLSGYAAYGYFSAPFPKFAASVLFAVVVWTTGLFYLSYTFGALTTRWLGYWQWPAVVLALFFPTVLVRFFLQHSHTRRTND